MAMKLARGPIRKLRRFADGGSVRQVDSSVPPITPGPNAQIYQPQTQNMGQTVMSGIQTGLKAGQAYKDSTKDGGGSKTGVGSPDSNTAGMLSREQESYKRGGPIRKTYGPKIGKEDGIIAAQKGEYVIKKSAVKKLGKKALDTVNRGKIPSKGVSRGR